MAFVLPSAPSTLNGMKDAQPALLWGRRGNHTLHRELSEEIKTSIYNFSQPPYQQQCFQFHCHRPQLVTSFRDYAFIFLSAAWVSFFRVLLRKKCSVISKFKSQFIKLSLNQVVCSATSRLSEIKYKVSFQGRCIIFHCFHGLAGVLENHTQCDRHLKNAFCVLSPSWALWEFLD